MAQHIYNPLFGIDPLVIPSDDKNLSSEGQLLQPRYRLKRYIHKKYFIKKVLEVVPCGYSLT